MKQEYLTNFYGKQRCQTIRLRDECSKLGVLNLDFKVSSISEWCVITNRHHQSPEYLQLGEKSEMNPFLVTTQEMRTRDLRVVLSFFGRWSGNPQTEFAYPLRNKLNKTSWTLNSSRSLRRSPTALPSTERLFPTNLQMMSCTSLRKWWIVNKSLLKISNNSN